MRFFSHDRQHAPLFPLLLGISALGVLSGCAALPEGVADSEAWQPTPPALMLPEAPANGAIYQNGQDVRLFENAVARRVGDTLTIRLVETMNAAKSSSTETSKSTGVELPGPTIAGRPVTANGIPILQNSLESDKSFTGEGSSRQSNSLFGDITVTVAQRWPNGNLLVRGEKWITINQGREFVRVSGIVRSVDISPNNSVLSTQIANARISYAGRGAINDANSPGLLSRFFNLPWLPL